MKFKKYYFILILFLAFFRVLSQQVTTSEYNTATLNVYDNPDKSIEVAFRMLETSNQYRQKINALLLISNAYSSKREYEKSLNYALKAKELSEKNNDSKCEIMVLNKIAAQYHQLGVNDKALQYLDESEKIISDYPHKDSIRIILGNNYGVRGFIYRDQLSCDIAIDYFNRSLEQFSHDANNPRMLANISVISYNKGNCFITLAQYDSARINFEKSLTFAQKTEAKSLEGFSRKGLAEVFTLKGNYQDAISELNKAVQVSENVGDLVLNQGLYKGLADNYLAINERDKYQKYFNKYLNTEAQNKAEEKKTISISLSKYASEINNQISKIKSTYTVAISVAVLFIFGLISFIIFGQNKFNKQFKLLKSQLKFIQKE